MFVTPLMDSLLHYHENALYLSTSFSVAQRKLLLIASLEEIELQGLLVQIGLVPNTDWLGKTVERIRLL